MEGVSGVRALQHSISFPSGQITLCFVVSLNHNKLQVSRPINIKVEGMGLSGDPSLIPDNAVAIQSSS